jgi:hypothetical protein
VQNPSSEATVFFSLSGNLELNGSLPISQNISASHYHKESYYGPFSPSISFKINFKENLSSAPSSSRRFFLLEDYEAKLPMHLFATCPAHYILIQLMPVKIADE